MSDKKYYLGNRIFSSHNEMWTDRRELSATACIPFFQDFTRGQGLRVLSIVPTQTQRCRRKEKLTWEEKFVSLLPRLVLVWDRKYGQAENQCLGWIVRTIRRGNLSKLRRLSHHLDLIWGNEKEKYGKREDSRILQQLISREVVRMKTRSKKSSYKVSHGGFLSPGYSSKFLHVLDVCSTSLSSVYVEYHLQPSLTPSIFGDDDSVYVTHGMGGISAIREMENALWRLGLPLEHPRSSSNP